ncbi:methylenetetrahydrofolate reductase [Halomonas eurihalina]|uniref:Methylenetetrahydrofolate reductase n=1 Tax=Halomonas eurihalina TaxID=42566 RepID=A0A5D9CKI0_HALER|nr:methylenetetrahydrofolate reductase [Halomonas eurihalina]MDR5858430.1 methylenetetrahydrofolate reductase [Halomonas eurihalina]TZG31692.1 methylenetetrahydrofolate reductase [Halomonas eurihalina]
MKFDDEPVPGYSLPVLPGHVSPGRLERVLRAGRFAVTTEIDPPDSADPAEVLRRAAIFDGYVDAINATDGSGANCHMSSVGVCSLLTRVGYATILQMSCRDRNRIAMQGEILGAAAMGACNLLCLTGDGVQAGDHPHARPVFDLDSLSLLGIARRMRDESCFESGRPIDSPPRMFLGAAANPFVPPRAWRAQRLAKKVAAGARFIQTQYCFDTAVLRDFMAEIADFGLLEGPDRIHVLVGMGPLRSARSARWIRDNVPGIHIPDRVIERLEGAQDQREEGARLCRDILQEVREIEGVSGAHIMAYRQEATVARIIEETGVLEGRVPWYPGRDNPAELNPEAPEAAGDLPATASS